MLTMIDNYDSFTYNLVQYFAELGAEVEVYRNDQVALVDIERREPAGLVLSPGPGTPDSAGITLAAVAHFKGRVPIFGVCLGQQSIGQHFGGRIVHAKDIMHGKLSEVHHTGRGVFAGLPNPFVATRYHSLVIDPDTCPDELEITAWTLDAQGRRDAIMGVRHRTLAIEGVQFHPESISSEHGHTMLRNFLSMTNEPSAARPDREVPR